MVGDVVGATSHINLLWRDGKYNWFYAANFAAELTGVGL